MKRDSSTVVEEPRTSESHFRALVESAPDAIVICNPDGRIELINAQTEALFGYRREELEGQGLEMLVPERFRHQHVGHRQGYAAAPQTRPMGTGQELYARRKDGSEFPVLISLSPIRSSTGLSIFSAIRDISSQRAVEQSVRELNERLARQNAELKAVNQELEAFSYSVSHDLRAPLRAIDGFSRILVDEHGDLLDSTANDLLQRVRRATQQMGRLIDDLLKLSRVTRSDLQLQEVNLSNIAREVVEGLQQQDAERSVDFTCAPDLAVWGDSKLLRIALDNLIGNAWKFTSRRDQARIEFAHHDDQGRPTYCVTDNGAGFDMDYSNKLFGAFQRLHDASEFPGTGIGLATVQRIIHKHGGHIWAKAAVEAGATFCFTLPREEKP